MTTPPTATPLGSRLLIQARLTDAVAVADMCAAEQVGAVFTTASTSAARDALTQVRRVSSDTPVLFDAAAYSGNRRKPASAGIDRRWIDTQHALGAARALTDSGYVAEGDLAGLRCILDSARRTDGPVDAVLPLAGAWWEEGNWQILNDQIGEHAVPVAFVLEHPSDPFSVQRTVRSVVALFDESTVPVTLLRTDLSGLGALAFGATAAAIGTSSSLRHLYPVRDSWAPQRQPSLLWPQGLAYRTVDRLTDAIAADPDDIRWICNCTPCYGRSIEWILNSPDPHTHAFRHSIAVLRALADDIDGPTAEARRSSWLEHCRVAQAFSYEVRSIAGKGWEPPKALAAWNRALPARVS